MKTPTLLLVLLLLAFIPHHAIGQDPQTPSWELGWETDMDTKYVVDLEEDWDLTGELFFYIDNSRMTEVNLEIVYDYDEDGPFNFDGPESVTVGGGANESFEITITGAEAETVRLFSPTSRITLTITVQETIGTTNVATQEIEGDVTTPRQFRLSPTMISPEDDLFPGSWVEFKLTIENWGNHQDAITSAKADIKLCPHLSVTGLDELEGAMLPVTSSTTSVQTFTLRYEASSSHPQRTCEVTISVTSEGNQQSYSASTTIDVNAPEQNSVQDDNSGTDNTNENDGTSTSSLPFISLLDTILIFFLTFVYYRRRF